jgi:hypothetical protein
MRDMTNNMHVVQLFPPKAAVTDGTAQVSNIIDLQGYDGCTLVYTTGVLTDADATWSCLVEEGDAANMSDAAAVADKDLIGTEALAAFIFSDDNECRKIGYKGSKRYLRVTIDDTTANTGNLFLAGVACLFFPAVAPTANPPQ